MSTPSTSNANANTTHEVHLAIYDLSRGMARSLSAQILGPQHALDIVPHTALVVYGKEYFFGQGIQWCHPNEFRMSRGIHPIDVQPLGHTTCTEAEFEEWCRRQGAGRANGRFGVESYDLLHRNCNNFSHEAAVEGLRLGSGVPQWILEVPRKFLSSPMGMVLRPMLEEMQLTNNAPTNIGGGGSMGMPSSFSSNVAPSPSLTSSASVAAANPWANIPSDVPSMSTPAHNNQTTPDSKTNIITPLLDKQTGPLLSTETGVVHACVSRLVPATTPSPTDPNNSQQQQRDLLSKLSIAANASWTTSEINSVHRHLCSFIANGTNVSFALMLLRLVVLRQPSSSDDEILDNESSIKLVSSLLLDDDKATNLATRSMAWCVLSNAAGSTNPPPCLSPSGNNTHETLLPLIDAALSDCNPPSSTDASTLQSNISLRQSASAFLYNVSRSLAGSNSANNNAGDNSGNEELSEATMAILIGCLENIGEEKDATTLTRRCMCLGQLLKARKYWRTAVELVRDLGLVDEVNAVCGGANGGEVVGLAKEVVLLLSRS